MNQKYLTKLFEKVNISEKTKMVYINNLSILNDKNLIKNLSFLSNTTNLMSKLEDKTTITKRNYLISVCKALSLIKRPPKLEEAYIFYKKVLMELNAEIKSNVASKKTIDNWLTLDEIRIKLVKYKSIFNRLDKKQLITPNDWDQLLNGVVLFIYTLIAPRRTTDYQDMIVLDNQDDELSSNLLIVQDRQFVFKNYKTKKVYGDQIVDIPPNLMKFIKIYLKFHPCKGGMKWFFVKMNGNRFINEGFIHSRLSTIFNKKVGSTQMRRIYITSKYKPKQDEMKKDAVEMGTSTNVINSNYIKQNLN